MTNSETGGRGMSAERSEAAYDRLPPVVRRAFQDAAFDWACQDVEKERRRGKLTPFQLAAMVESYDRDEIERGRSEASKFMRALRGEKAPRRSPRRRRKGNR